MTDLPKRAALALIDGDGNILQLGASFDVGFQVERLDAGAVGDGDTITRRYNDRLAGWPTREADHQLAESIAAGREEGQDLSHPAYAMALAILAMKTVGS